MAVTLKAKIHCVILLTGITIFCLGISLLSAGFMIEHDKFEKITSWPLVPSSQYWAGIPVIITGILLIGAAYNKEKTHLKILCVVLLLVSMVVTLAVMVELGDAAAGSYGRIKLCYKYDYTKDDCNKIREIGGWLQILAMSADIVLVLCLVALLAIFADWILFTRKGQQICQEQPRPGYGALPAECAQPMNGENPPAYGVNPTGETIVQMVQLPQNYSYPY